VADAPTGLDAPGGLGTRPVLATRPTGVELLDTCPDTITGDATNHRVTAPGRFGGRRSRPRGRVTAAERFAC